ncbi:hypothetical protein BLNAU_20139 [Blattamonas nauphoetae]|uniref:Secreted protein n=1 Tax=Blattamonas nauphoetae TaxID=2049346 RepID=A0ABQ9WZK9_9EUKA|nr:hypothetical protein BLNAU_20139 [Blattamonas nauphoetae]
MLLLLVLRFVCGSERARQLRMKKQKDCGWDEPTQTPSEFAHHRSLVKLIVALWRHHIGPAESSHSSIVGEDLLPHSECFLAPSSTQQNTVCMSHPQLSTTSFDHTTSISVTDLLRLDETFEDGN